MGSKLIQCLLRFARLRNIKYIYSFWVFFCGLNAVKFKISLERMGLDFVTFALNYSRATCMFKELFSLIIRPVAALQYDLWIHRSTILIFD